MIVKLIVVQTVHEYGDYSHEYAKKAANIWNDIQDRIMVSLYSYMAKIASENQIHLRVIVLFVGERSSFSNKEHISIVYLS